MSYCEMELFLGAQKKLWLCKKQSGKKSSNDTRGICLDEESQIE